MAAEAPSNLPDAIGRSLGSVGKTFLELFPGGNGDAAKFASDKLLLAAIAVLALVVSYFVAKLLARWVSVAICLRVDQTLGKFAGRCTFYATMICASLSILATAGIGVAGVAAVFTAAGFAVGLAFQGTLSNFASGILLLVFRPFKVGDLVIASGVTGKVNEIDLFTTTLDTPDNRRLIIPNSLIAGTTIENITYHAHRRVDVPVGIAYHCDLDESRKALELACQSLREYMINGEGRGYQVMLLNLGPSSVDWVVRFWTATQNVFLVKERLIGEIKRKITEAGLTIPFPQMQLHITQENHAEEMSPGDASSNPAKLRPRLRMSMRDAG